MLALLQRVNFAKVVVDGKGGGQIDKGILAFIGLEKGDNETKCKRMFDKIVKYRIRSSTVVLMYNSPSP